MSGSISKLSFDDSESLSGGSHFDRAAAYEMKIKREAGMEIGKPEFASYYGPPSDFEDTFYRKIYAEIKEEQEYKPIKPVDDGRSAEYRPGDEYRGMSQIVRRKKTEWTGPPQWEALSYKEILGSSHAWSTSQSSKKHDALKEAWLEEDLVTRQVPPIPIVELHNREQTNFQNLYHDLSTSGDIDYLRHWILKNLSFFCEYKVVFPQLVEIVKTYGTPEDRQWASEVQCIKTSTSENWDAGAYMRLLTIIWDILEDCYRAGALKQREDELQRYYQYPLQARALAQAYEKLKHKLAEVARLKAEKEAQLREVLYVMHL